MSAERHVDCCILQPGYLPWLGYFDQVALADTFVFYDDVQFDHHGWRNRNRFLARGAPQWITVPVKTSGRLSQTCREVEVFQPDYWPKKHLATIRTLYGPAPHFDWVYPALEAYLTKAKGQKWLIDVCLEGHRTLTSLFGITTPTRFSSELGHRGIGRTERLVAVTKTVGATRYISADASKSYMKEEFWREAGLDLVYQRYPHPKYEQYAEPFVPYLSAVDALMFVGPKVKEYVAISHSKVRAPRT